MANVCLNVFSKLSSVATISSAIKQVTVIGGGIMGSGIAQVNNVNSV